MNVFLLIWLFILGLCVGSFLNVLIDRLPKDKSVIKDRSYCDFCGHTLSWYDLIPLLSIIILGRRCRYCHKKISWQYPLVELITGFLFAYSYSSTPGEPLQVTSPVVSLSPLYFPEAIFLFIVISGLIVIFFTDLKYRIIPDQVVIILTVSSLLYFLLFNHQALSINHLFSGVVMFLIFFTLLILTKGKGMGFGDVKFAGVMGLILGFPKVVVSFYLAFLTGAILSLILIISGKKTMKSTIPFGPFLTASTVVSIFYGEQLWHLFKSILGI